MSAINVLTIQGYYYLYALFFDYPINNEYYVRGEERERIREYLRAVQPILGLKQPFRLDVRLRLFTQRQSMERFSPEKVHELLRQLRNTVELAAEPPPHPLRRATDRPLPRRFAIAKQREIVQAAEAPEPQRPPLPRWPMDYRMIA